MMKERPEVFRAPQVLAFLEDRKTQDRRVMKQAMGPDGPAASVHPDGAGFGWIAWWPRPISAEETRKCYPGKDGFPCPYGQPGDRLWVRETWQVGHDTGSRPRRYSLLCPTGATDRDGKVFYKADGNAEIAEWRPSIVMPRWASRITEEIIAVRVERLQEIGEGDAIAEGWEPTKNDPPGNGGPFDWYRHLWDSINGKRFPWAVNPFVWVRELRRLAVEVNHGHV